MTTPPLGRVEWLDIREVWSHEATGFTPWLLENADELGAALGLELQLEEAEHPVGGFSLDLIGRDLTHGARLIVENQIEQSDHGHLGQLLTYAAGTDAATIVWVAKAFKDEHRVAIDWLNEHTAEDVRFFAVVVRSLRVGDSLPAPFFELAAKPNDWQKAVRQATSTSPEGEAYREFWLPARARLVEVDPGLLTGRSEPKSIWLGMNSPIPRTSISGEIGSGELRTRLDIGAGDRERNLATLRWLQEQRATLEAELGELVFLEGNHRCSVVLRRPWQGKLITQPDAHDEARTWFVDSMLELHRACTQLVENGLPEF